MRYTSLSCSPERFAYLQARRREAVSVHVLRLLVLIAFLFLWEMGARWGWVDPFILSCPSRVLVSLANLYADGTLFLHIGTTLFETVAGFLLGTALGVALAVLLWWMHLLDKVMDPYLVVLNALPKIALGPVLIVWIGAGMESIIVMAVLISLVVTTVTVLGGFAAATGEKQLLMDTLGASRFPVFEKVGLPARVPDLNSALKISVGMSWVGVIVGEYLVSQAGLGYLIVYGGQVFRLDLVMASVVVLCLLAALMYAAVALLEKRIRRRFSA